MEPENRDHTLPELANILGMTSAALAKRIHRGTLKARKEKGKWLVSQDEFNRVTGMQNGMTSPVCDSEIANAMPRMSGLYSRPQNGATTAAESDESWESSKLLSQIQRIRDELRQKESQVIQAEEHLRSLKESLKLLHQLLETTERLQNALAKH